MSKAEVEEMLNAFIMDCATKEGATADEIGFIRTYGTPQNRPQKCAVACVGEMFGIVSVTIKCTFYRLKTEWSE